MKKIRYSAGMKAVAILLQELFSVALVVCIILVSTLFDRSMLDLGDIRNKEFTQSGYYEQLFRGAVEEVLDYIEYKKQFETDGVYNPEKAVNIMAYMNINSETSNVQNSLTGSEKFRYYLIDLENWSKDYATVPFRVENRLYMTQKGLLHQVQEVYVNEETVRESDTELQKLGDMDISLQEQIVSAAQYYYGGYYNIDEQLQLYSEGADALAFSDVDKTSEARSMKTALNEDGGAAVGESGAEEEVETVEPEAAQSDTGPETEPEATDTGSETESDVSYEETGMGAEELSAEDMAKKKLLQDSIQKIIDGRLYELKGEALIVVLEDLELLEVSATVNGPAIEEKYLTVGGTTILEEFLNESISLEEMSRVYESLAYTLDTIGNEITAYKRLINHYEKGSSNLQFWIYDESSNQYFSNMEDLENKMDIPNRGKALGSYFYYSRNDIRLDTNVKGVEEAFYQRQESGNNDTNSVIFIGMDTTFPYEDSYREAMKDYNHLQPWAASSLSAAGISVFGIFLCFIYLSLAAGRNREDDEIHLNWFDQIKTELFLAGFGIICAGTLFVFRITTSYLKNSDLMGLVIMAGGITLTVVGLFMIFYMSFVRRVKAGVIWSGSLLCWIGKGMKKVIRNWKLSVKIVLVFLLHVIVSLLFGVIALVWSYNNTVVLFMLTAYLFLCIVEVVLFLREGVQRNVIINGIKRIARGDLEYEIDTTVLRGENQAMGEAVNMIGKGLYHAVDDSVKNERLKADLITNVSHDIKTPLTSIINYVDLLKREEMDNDRVKNYIEVLDAKSQRLKQLTEDLVEASKVSSGNITLQIDRLNLVELVYQTAGEFDEKFEARGLTAVTKIPKEPVVILADGRRIWRVLENLYNNVAKYAMPNTRVYVDMEVRESIAIFSIKNISEQALNIDASELTERFIRGDVSRSTEGSGLGLSIAKNLTNLMGGTFDIYLDGDLFKVTVTFPVAEEE